MIPKGRYNARAKSWDLGETSKGKPQVAIEFEITMGEQKGQRRTWYGLFDKGTDKNGETYDTAQRVIESLRYCGWRGNDITDLTGLDANEVSVSIDHEEYNGQTRDRIRWVNRLGGGLALKNKMADATRAKLAKQLKGVAMSVPVDLADSAETPLPKSDVNGNNVDDESDGYGSAADPTEDW